MYIFSEFCFVPCVEADSFVAIDCLVIDSQVERAYFYKLGAPPSFIRKVDGNVLVVRGSKPPAGAVTDILCYGTSEPEVGDLIFLVSDGVFRSALCYKVGI